MMVKAFCMRKLLTLSIWAWETTHLVFIKEEVPILVGYFLFANRPLKMTRKNFKKLSKNQQRKLQKYGREEDGYIEINSYLIGQLGKNYNVDKDIKDKVSGRQLLSIAYQMLVDIVKVVNVKYVWVECEDNGKFLDFYQDFGFNLIKDSRGENQLNVLIMAIK